jgi:hypothetical protein
LNPQRLAVLLTTVLPMTVLPIPVLLIAPKAAVAHESFETVRQQFEARSVTVVSDHPRCSERNLFGLYVRGSRQVIVCRRGNQVNTLLHEGWHLAQARCLSGTSYLGKEWLNAQLSWRDRRDLDALYKTGQWRREAEARYMANQSLERYFAAFDALCTSDATPRPTNSSSERFNPTVND